MPQLVAFAAVGAALWLGYRWFARETERVQASMRAAEEELRRRAEARRGEPEIGVAGTVDVRGLPKLERDPDTGEFRVKH
jgi:hypothetical protein